MYIHVTTLSVYVVHTCCMCTPVVNRLNINRSMHCMFSTRKTASSYTSFYPLDIFFAASSPDETSRCSSSMGYLEPRPLRLSPTSTPSHPTPHELLSRLTTTESVRGESCDTDTRSLSDVGCVMSVTSEGVDSPRSIERATLPTSTSTQSLNTLSGNSKRTKSFGSFFNRCSEYGSWLMLILWSYYLLCTGAK